MDENEADRLAAEGRPIKLSTGTVHIRFTFAVLRRLERTFGFLNAIERGLMMATDGPLYDTCARVIACCLAQPVEAIEEQLITQEIAHYALAIREAFSEALPDASSEPADPNSPATDGSNGESSTTLPLSDSVAVTVTSGA